jgi:hypothetical protein
MKKTLLLILLLCNVCFLQAQTHNSSRRTPKDREVKAGWVDAVHEENFLITPLTHVDFDYEPIGIINIEVIPALVYVEIPSQYKTNVPQKKLVLEEIAYQDFAKEAIKVAKSKGADAIINYSVEKQKQVAGQESAFDDNDIYLTYIIKGYCIKRK